MALSEFQKIIQINLIGTFNMMKFSAEKMSKQNIISQNGERGVIINTASVAAFEGQ
ncbi:MAG: 3-hydroxyacyl CoA dehydrogenase, partial [uncultured bacterium]